RPRGPRGREVGAGGAGRWRARARARTLKALPGRQGDSMATKKRILVVDDERDVCGMVADALGSYDVREGYAYDEARAKLAKGGWDAVILDIMGVRGHDLLEEFSGKAPCIMLTAHALTAKDMKRSIAGHAVLYLPKDELGRIDEYVREVLAA